MTLMCLGVGGFAMLGLPACSDGGAEDAGEEIDDALEDAADDVEDAVDDVTDEIGG